jgi:uncharacterized membrane protein
MTDLKALGNEILQSEDQFLKQLRTLRRKRREGRDGASSGIPALTVGQRIADTVAATMGSWKFIIIQSLILIVWIVLNLIAVIQHWDPYPFILLNLALSFQAAYAAPFIMMSQNRQQDIDRQAAESDYHINIKAELEIKLRSASDHKTTVPRSPWKSELLCLFQVGASRAWESATAAARTVRRPLPSINSIRTY